MELTQSYIDYRIKTERLLRSGGILCALKGTEDEIFIPAKRYPSDAGFDCRARIEEPIMLEPGDRVNIPLGFALNVPFGHVADLRPRSGMSRDHGINVFYGTIDAGYTGELTATLINQGKEPYMIQPKNRIAQLVILPISISPNLNQGLSMVQTHELYNLERGENGHNSTGVA